ncbi:MAG TPA: hypothetical protein VG797_09275 [Phycisphaerales bacterium]|nr:hypothetical protein [Phycisphaerales bacterium]
MGVTASLVRLYRVDQQRRGLSGRLRTAESYLNEQERILGQLDAQAATISAQLKQLEASAHNDEVESKSFEQRIESLRERMNNSRTSKEHSAILTEINTLKADRGLVEERALKSMTKTDELRAEVAKIEEQRVERRKMRDIAAADRDARAAEIKERLAELDTERAAALAGVPATAMSVYQARLLEDEENALAPVEEQDRRNMEYTCGSCCTHLPIELVSILLKRGDITRCPSCKAILYMEETLRDSISDSQQKKKGGKKAVNAE